MSYKAPDHPYLRALDKHVLVFDGAMAFSFSGTHVL
jgi:hypothetical protein